MRDLGNEIPGGSSPSVNAAAILRVERAAAELRYGRAVRIEAPDGAVLAALPLDAIGPSAYADFANAADDKHAIYLTGHRASVLGLGAPDGVLVPLAGLSFENAALIGYLRGVDVPARFDPADASARESVALAKLALLLPVTVCAAIEPDHPAFVDALTIHVGDCERAALSGRGHFEIVTETDVPLKDIERARFTVFRGGLAQRDQIAVIVGEPDRSKPVPVRVHSSCITGDLFGSLKCDCGDQLRNGLRMLQKKGGGVLLYLDQEGRGTGIGAKMRAYGMQADGLDTVDADAVLGFGADERRYEAAAAMLSALGIGSVDLLTNNPSKVRYLQASGIDVAARTPVLGQVTTENEGYLRTKAKRAGHMMDVDRLLAGSA